VGKKYARENQGGFLDNIKFRERSARPLKGEGRRGREKEKSSRPGRKEPVHWERGGNSMGRAMGALKGKRWGGGGGGTVLRNANHRSRGPGGIKEGETDKTT